MILKSSVSFSHFQGPDSWDDSWIPTSGLLVPECVYSFLSMQTRHNVGVKDTCMKSAFTASTCEF